MKNPSTLPNDTIPLANWHQDIQDALLGIRNPGDPTERELRAALKKIVRIYADPALNSKLDRICPDRRQK